MREHELNSLNNFIGAWTLDDTSICDELVQYHQNTKYKGPGKTGGTIDKSIKDSIDCTLDDPALFRKYDTEYLQPILEKYKEKYPYCNATAAWRHQTTPNIQYYPPGGGYYNWHCERLGSNLPYRNRHLVYMTYLNDVDDAGETEFYHQQLKIKPKKGLTVIWPADWTFTHRGITSPTQDKYIITGWYAFIDG